MKPREPRRPMMLNSRLRCGAAWSNACILNVSSRGLGLQAVAPPVRGTYVEVRRASSVIVARVMWVDGQRFGVQTQDPVSMVALTGEQSGADESAPAPRPVERALIRTRELHDASRAAGRAIEFLFIAILALSAASAAFAVVGTAIGRPIATINKALAPR